MCTSCLCVDVHVLPFFFIFCFVSLKWQEYCTLFAIFSILYCFQIIKKHVPVQIAAFNQEFPLFIQQCDGILLYFLFTRAFTPRVKFSLHKNTNIYLNVLLHSTRQLETLLVSARLVFISYSKVCLHLYLKIVSIIYLYLLPSIHMLSKIISYIIYK